VYRTITVTSFYYRAREREKLKAKRLEAKLNNIDLGPSRKLLKNKRMENSKCKIHVAIDMSFDDYMVDKVMSALCFVDVFGISSVKTFK